MDLRRSILKVYKSQKKGESQDGFETWKIGVTWLSCLLLLFILVSVVGRGEEKIFPDEFKATIKKKWTNSAKAMAAIQKFHHSLEEHHKIRLYYPHFTTFLSRITRTKSMTFQNAKKSRLIIRRQTLITIKCMKHMNRQGDKGVTLGVSPCLPRKDHIYITGLITGAMPTGPPPANSCLRFAPPLLHGVNNRLCEACSAQPLFPCTGCRTVSIDFYKLSSFRKDNMQLPKHMKFYTGCIKKAQSSTEIVAIQLSNKQGNKHAVARGPAMEHNGVFPRNERILFNDATTRLKCKLQAQLQLAKQRNNQPSKKCDEITEAIELAEQYSYQYNIKIMGVPQLNEKESAETTANLCIKLFTAMGVTDVSLQDIDIAHRVQSRRPSQNSNPIICKFVRRLAKEKIMAHG
ncbi:Hypothetical predicted protein, partial [Paramuricea clavata]